MKKFALLLALATVASMCLTACNGAKEETTTANTTVATTTKSGPKQTMPSIIPPTTGGEVQAPDLLNSENFKLDGDLSEYEGLNTLVLQGQTNDEVDTDHKKVTFYGAMTDAGLYLACDAYHDIYVGDNGTWYLNSNFEFFIGTGSAQKYVYARGIDQPCAKSGDDIEAFMKTEELEGDGAKYHTVTEVFVSVANLSESDILYNTIDVGVAWKTAGDLILGGVGTAGPGGSDEYWVITWPANNPKPIVAPSGIFMPDEYEF